MHKNAPKGVRLVALLIALLLVAGCTGVQVQEGAASLTGSALGGHESVGSVAIVGIDFDPPLQYADTLRRQGVTLLVAVENRGSEPVDEAWLVARLIATGPQHERLVLERTGVVSGLKPGQVTVYRFPRLRNIPLRRSYALDVKVFADAAGSATPLAERRYDIRVLAR